MGTLPPYTFGQGWTPAQTRAFLVRCYDRDALLVTLLHYAQTWLQGRLICVVKPRGVQPLMASGWASWGDDAETTEELSQITLPVEEGGALGRLVERAAPMFGVLSQLGLEPLFEQTSVVAPTHLMVIPITIAGRAKILFFGEPTRAVTSLAELSAELAPVAEVAELISAQLEEIVRLSKLRKMPPVEARIPTPPTRHGVGHDTLRGLRDDHRNLVEAVSAALAQSSSAEEELDGSLHNPLGAPTTSEPQPRTRPMRAVSGQPVNAEIGQTRQGLDPTRRGRMMEVTTSTKGHTLLVPPAPTPSRARETVDARPRPVSYDPQHKLEPEDSGVSIMMPIQVSDAAKPLSKQTLIGGFSVADILASPPTSQELEVSKTLRGVSVPKPLNPNESAHPRQEAAASLIGRHTTPTRDYVSRETNAQAQHSLTRHSPSPGDSHDRQANQERRDKRLNHDALETQARHEGPATQRMHATSQAPAEAEQPPKTSAAAEAQVEARERAVTLREVAIASADTLTQRAHAPTPTASSLASPELDNAQARPDEIRQVLAVPQAEGDGSYEYVYDEPSEAHHPAPEPQAQPAPVEPALAPEPAVIAAPEPEPQAPPEPAPKPHTESEPRPEPHHAQTRPLPSVDVQQWVDRLESRDHAAAFQIAHTVPARAELIQALCARFPGRLVCDRYQLPVDKLPPVERHSPTLAALAHIGAPAADAVAALLEQASLDIRFYATYLFTRLPAEGALGALLKRAFDRDAQTRAVAMRVIAAHRHSAPTLVGEVLLPLRQRISAHEDDLSLEHAAELLGLLRDVSSVELLIHAMGRSRVRTAQTIHQALQHITLQPMPPAAVAWRTWWAEGQREPRSAWVLRALNATSEVLRELVAQELEQLPELQLNYHPKQPPSMRLRAQQDLKAWLDAQAAQGLHPLG